MTDSSEAVTAEYTYDAFGNLIAQTETSENVYKFTGEQFDSSSGLLYLRHRYYSPDIGRFVNRDPVLKQMPFYDNFIWYLPYLIEAPENLNAYVYVTNNPIKYVDPNGLAWWDPTTWNTTNYCGWTKSRSDKEPRSKIDACCKQHDECLAQDNVGSCLQGWKKGVRDCHKDLVKCVSKIK
jgi:RHS repeat-associated protein